MAERRRPANYPVLLVQLVLANIAVAAAVTLTLYWLFTRLMDSYFDSLMDEFDVSPTKLNTMFAMDVEQSLWWGIAVALALGIALSLILTRLLLAPISRMVRAARRIGLGDLSARAPVLKGELGTLSWQLNEMADALERQEEERRQLLRDLSHELRTPLTNLKGYVEGLEDGVFHPGPEVFGVLDAEVGRLSLLIDDLNALSLAEGAGDRLDLVSLDPAVQLGMVLDAHRAGLLEKGFEVEIVHEGTPGTMQADPKRLQQIFSNAISNMLHHAHPGGQGAPNRTTGRVTFFWEDPRRVRIEFQNPAAPISPGDMERLFDRFFRVDRSRSGRHNNVGLGLAIVRRLVMAHGGQVRAKQENGVFCLCMDFPRNPH